MTGSDPANEAPPGAGSADDAASFDPASANGASVNDASVDPTSADAASKVEEAAAPTGDEPVADLAAEMADAAAELAVEAAAAEVEVDLVVATVARERDEYLDALRRLQADFENYKKRMEKQKTEQVERAAGELVSKLLPVCDTVDLAIAHGGGEEVKQVWTALFDALERAGLERIDPVGVVFDPTVHDAVAHEPGDAASAGPEVVEVLRAGYRWKGRVLRPAMVKVRG